MDRSFQPRQMHDVSSLNIKCASCGADIKELPFEPRLRDDNTYGQIYCQECNRKRPRRFSRGPRRF